LPPKLDFFFRRGRSFYLSKPTFPQRVEVRKKEGKGTVRGFSKEGRSAQKKRETKVTEKKLSQKGKSPPGDKEGGLNLFLGEAKR